METSTTSFLNQITPATLRLKLTQGISQPYQGIPQTQTKNDRSANGVQMQRESDEPAKDAGTSPVPNELNIYVNSIISLEKELVKQREEMATLRKQVFDLKSQLVERDAQIQELDAYAYTVAHGLKTPLSVITFASEILLVGQNDSTPDPATPELLESIHRMGFKMAEIIEDLLTLTGLSQSHIEVEPLEMAPILEEVARRLASACAESGAQIIYTRPVDEWPAALGNGPLVEEIWENFINNAIKYGGTPPRIELGAEPIEGNMVRFWIQDNGPGVPQDIQSQLFKIFSRLHTHLADGYGLGLAIVDRIVRKLHGQVTVKSTGIPGEGSTFSFTLPAV